MRTLPLLTIFLVGCSASAVTRDEAVRRPTESSDGAPRLGLPGAFSKLGASCGSELATGASFICGRDHRIASLTIAFQSPPHGGVVHWRKYDDRNEAMAMGSNTVEIDGPYVWIESSCRECRMMISSTTVIDLRLIDDEGLAQQQLHAGLPRSPLLRTATAWNAATSGPKWESRRYD